ncbi:hypothetical protein [Litchfieldella xinjiangensis]|uniref:hypothetical protein n=1 Tax=Litchfieldella xinjiangensis TaxID=1166948 RepID=UPI0005BC31BF|nr:hypothetical protein [Halomonas xinjiangensis]
MDYRILAKGGLLALTLALSQGSLAQEGTQQNGPAEANPTPSPDRQGTAVIDAEDPATPDENGPDQTESSSGNSGSDAPDTEFKSPDDTSQPIRPGQLEQGEQVEPVEDDETQGSSPAS